MEITLVIEVILGLVIILAFLIFLLLYSSKKKQIKKQKIVKPVKSENSKPSLEDLKSIVKDTTTTSKELDEALDLVLKLYANIGLNDSQPFEIYMNILIAICRHPKTNKNIIIDFEKKLVMLNPKYKTEINNAITAGLDSRSI
ncbi:MAG: hypothetical protein U9P72_12070 [Campylobacterota bacterium]|nr:hypothetical protein [Campylobacterota bacterium]